MLRSLLTVLAVIGVLAANAAPVSATHSGAADSVRGHGLVVDEEENITYQFNVSAHTLSETTTVATGKLYVELTQTDPVTGLRVNIRVWADVYCLWAVSFNAQVRANVTHSEPALGTPLMIAVELSDLDRFTNLPDRFTFDSGPAVPCTPPEVGLEDIDKGGVQVRDEGMQPLPPPDPEP